jgi:glycosyltransferase involved in cell wall biosynthesis
MSFDVIIPAHNCENTVGEAVTSALGQNLPPREVWVVADACEDGTAERAARAGARVLTIDAHSAAVARNAGAARARGEFLAFLDADDLWMPEWLKSVQRAAQRHPEADLFFGGVEELLPLELRIRRHARMVTKVSSYERLLCECFLITSAVVVRRSAFDQQGGFRIEFSDAGVEDYDLWLRLAGLKPFVPVPGIHVLYRRNASGATRTPERFARLEADTERVVADALARRQTTRAVQRRAWSNVYRMSAERYLAHGLGKQALRPARRALMQQPTSLRLWIIVGLCLLPTTVSQVFIYWRRGVRSLFARRKPVRA